MKNNIRLVATDGAPSRLLQEHSPARMRLAKLINDRLSVEAKLRDLAEAMERLNKAQGAEAQAAAALANFEAQETAAMAEWSKSSQSSPMPVANPARRDDLLAAIRAASAQAESARAAAKIIEAEQTREQGLLARLEPQFAIAIAEVLAEAVEPLLGDFEAANKQLASKAARIQEAFNAIRSLGESIANPSAARPVFVINEQLHERIRAVSGRASPDARRSESPRGMDGIRRQTALGPHRRTRIAARTTTKENQLCPMFG